MYEKYSLDELIYLSMKRLMGATCGELLHMAVSGRSLNGLRDKFKKYGVTPLKGPTNTRSIRQYATWKELYADFGEECPLTDEELRTDLSRRYSRWRKKLDDGEID